MTRSAPPHRPAPLPPALLSRLSDTVAAHLGLHFPPERWVELERGFRPAARELGFDDPAACAEALAARPLTRAQTQALATHLTIGETYFFRERGSFRTLEERVLPELTSGRPGHGRRGRLTLWSAACCTGEEAYSLAISVTRALGDPGRWGAQVLATDVNPRFLEKAAAGTYGEWSFRDTPAAVRERYFRRTAHGRYEVLPEIRRLVKFDYLNLAEDACPPLPDGPASVDIVFCRNVIIYLEPGRAGGLCRRLAKCLSAGGWLFVGAAETSQTLFADLKAHYFHDAIAYQKPPAGAVAPGAPAPQRRFVPSPTGPQPPAAPAPTASAPATRAPHPHPASAVAAAAELSRACADRGDLHAALSGSERAIADNKLDPGLHYLRGVILQEMGDSTGALASFKRSLYLDPGFIMAHFAAGHLFRSRGNRRAATRHLVQAAGLLRALGPEQIVPESEGVTSARLAEIIASTLRAPAPRGAADEEAGE